MNPNIWIKNEQIGLCNYSKIISQHSFTIGHELCVNNHAAFYNNSIYLAENSCHRMIKLKAFCLKTKRCDMDQEIYLTTNVTVHFVRIIYIDNNWILIFYENGIRGAGYKAGILKFNLKNKTGIDIAYNCLRILSTDSHPRFISHISYNYKDNCIYYIMDSFIFNGLGVLRCYDIDNDLVTILVSKLSKGYYLHAFGNNLLLYFGFSMLYIISQFGNKIETKIYYLSNPRIFSVGTGVIVISGDNVIAFWENGLYIESKMLGKIDGFYNFGKCSMIPNFGFNCFKFYPIC